MKQQTKYGNEAARHAKVLISQGWTNEQIRSLAVCREIPHETLRRWRFRLKTKNETPNETPETLHETHETAKEVAVNEQPENPLAGVENAVYDVSKTFQSVSFTRMDAVFYSTIGTACIGAFHLIGWWCLLPCIPYALISVDALQTAKQPEMSKVAERGRVVVIILELIASVSNHSLFNAIFWANIDRLPVHVARQGSVVLIGGEAPAYAAAFVAFIMFCAAFYAVDTTILKAKIKEAK